MRARLRTILVVSTVAVAVAAAGAWALMNAGESSQAAATFPVQAPKTPAPGPTNSPGRPPAKKPEAVRATKATKPPVKKKPEYRVVDSGNCQASYYWEPQDTASGERFDPDALTAAHKTLPLNSKVRVTNENNGRSVIVRINDRGPYVGGRCLDLSKAAMASVGGTGSGVIPVKYQVLSRA